MVTVLKKVNIKMFSFDTYNDLTIVYLFNHI